MCLVLVRFRGADFEMRGAGWSLSLNQNNFYSILLILKSRETNFLDQNLGLQKGERKSERGRDNRLLRYKKNVLKKRERKKKLIFLPRDWRKKLLKTKTIENLRRHFSNGSDINKSGRVSAKWKKQRSKRTEFKIIKVTKIFESRRVDRCVEIRIFDSNMGSKFEIRFECSRLDSTGEKASYSKIKNYKKITKQRKNKLQNLLNKTRGQKTWSSCFGYGN